eukprot:Seg1945.6 transcript_id=Seg1945.6/GoldUCD/mRNA.D3Y31 product="hypothetical protein" protein_id=Seg1945.6/GoldUCD/D3Y31
MPPKLKNPRSRSEKDTESEKTKFVSCTSEAVESSVNDNVDDEIFRPPSWVDAFKAVLITEMEKTSSDKFNVFEKRVQHTLSSLQISAKEIQDKENEICLKLNGLESKLIESENVISNLKDDLETKSLRIVNLENQLDDLISRQCWKTLVFRGFPENCEGETDSWDNCRDFLIDFIHEKFGLEVEIERAHHAKKKTNATTSRRGSSRLSFAEFLSWRHSSALLEAMTKPVVFESNGKDPC